jgi:hypothetical protein
MIALPKLVLIVLVVFAVWYALRWLNRTPPKVVHQRRAPSPQPQPGVEDLTACQTCGAYVAASARACGKAGCPQPR